MAEKIISIVLSSASYCLSLFDTMLDATGLFGWFSFCFFTLITFRFLLMPLFGRGMGADFVSKKRNKTSSDD